MAGELNKLSDRKLKGLHGIPASKIEFYADGAGLSAKVTKVLVVLAGCLLTDSTGRSCIV
jgi:hypothetical protein